MAKGERRRWTPIEKVLVGCGIGCGVIGLAAGAAFVGGAYWVFSPGEQAPTGAIVGDGSGGTARIGDLAQDPGTRALLRQTVAQVNELQRRRQREELPPSLAWISDLQRQSPAAGELALLIPREVTISFEKAPEGGPPHVVAAANFRTLVRPFREILLSAARSAGKTAVLDHRGAQIVPGEEGGFAFVGGTLVASDSLAALRRAIDRLAAPGAAPPADAHPARVASLPGATESDWDARAVATDEDGLLDDFLAGWIEEPPRGGRTGAEEAFLGLDVVSGDTLQGRLLLLCADADAAALWQERLAARAEEGAARASAAGLRWDTSWHREGELVTGDLTVTGLHDAIGAWLEDLD